MGGDLPRSSPTVQQGCQDNNTSHGAKYKTFSRLLWIIAATLTDCESELVSTS